MSGDIDYLLRVVVPDIAAYDTVVVCRFVASVLVLTRALAKALVRLLHRSRNNCR